ncbi:hypothetical protein SLEP1_g55781 [Rubroshorea leprosula]|uniref:Retrovirus-related Pol polyprotein from transposon TNT 1-94-like beta-barrel domain-containing protein n=1 Tax=Rubroshorea leprosula TaxID=152421 RepID=A0AAV5MHL9_9ROSI|nr:hypothetical protein SLEP1_g55781 [Rubroshorea leprosula]
MATTLREMATNFQKLDRFDGGNFIQWQRKMHIFLTTLNISYVLTDARPEENENETLQDTRKRKKWENDDYVCRGCILNGMCDSLFDIYVHESTAKELWDKLEARYMNEDATNSGARKHVCKDKSLFKTLKPELEGSVLYVGNSAAVQVKGKGTVDLEFTSGKVLTVTNVHYVPYIQQVC